MRRFVSPLFGRELWLNVLAASPLISVRLRTEMLRRGGMDIATDAMVSPRCFVGGSDVAIGERTFINYQGFFDNNASITIGADCWLGARCVVLTSDHCAGTRTQRAGRGSSAPVVLGDGRWLGGSVTITPGVTIGEGGVIAAGVVVRSDCAPHGLYAGVPAERKKDLPQ